MTRRHSRRPGMFSRIVDGAAFVSDLAEAMPLLRLLGHAVAVPFRIAARLLP